MQNKPKQTALWKRTPRDSFSGSDAVGYQTAIELPTATRPQFGCSRRGEKIRKSERKEVDGGVKI